MLKLTIPSLEAHTKEELVFALSEIISGLKTGCKGGDLNFQSCGLNMWSLSGEEEITPTRFARCMKEAISDLLYDDEEFDVQDLLNINDRDANLVARRDESDIILLRGMQSKHSQYDTVLISSIEIDEDEVSRNAYQSMYEQLDLGENFDQVEINKMIETSHMDSLLEYKSEHTVETIKSKIENYNWEDWAESNSKAANAIAKAFSWI